jgi:hypothetical protein
VLALKQRHVIHIGLEYLSITSKQARLDCMLATSVTLVTFLVDNSE